MFMYGVLDIFVILGESLIFEIGDVEWNGVL